MTREPWYVRWAGVALQALLVLLVGSLFVVSFYESWAALTDAAVSTQIPHPGPWPWMVDGFIIAMGLMIVRAKALQNRRLSVAWFQVGLVFATGLSTGIQAAWAPVDDWAWALHAWSPLAVLFSFECLIHSIFTLAAEVKQLQTGELRDTGSPGRAAGGVAAAGTPVRATGDRSLGIQPGAVATPPPYVPMPADATAPGAGIGGTLSDRETVVTPAGDRATDRDAVVTEPSEKIVAAWKERTRRAYQRAKPAEQAARDHGVPLDRVTAWYAQFEAQYGPLSEQGNGHKQAVSA